MSPRRRFGRSLSLILKWNNSQPNTWRQGKWMHFRMGYHVDVQCDCELWALHTHAGCGNYLGWYREPSTYVASRQLRHTCWLYPTLGGERVSILLGLCRSKQVACGSQAAAFFREGKNQLRQKEFIYSSLGHHSYNTRFQSWNSSFVYPFAPLPKLLSSSFHMHLSPALDPTQGLRP